VNSTHFVITTANNHINEKEATNNAIRYRTIFMNFYYSCFLKANEATARRILKQVAVQPRPNEYPQKLLAAFWFPVKTAIDTSNKNAEEKGILLFYIKEVNDYVIVLHNVCTPTRNAVVLSLHGSSKKHKIA